VFACVVPLLAATASDAANAAVVHVHAVEATLSDHMHLSILMLRLLIVCISLFVLFCSHLACVMY
jgi:hypothetical protein